MDEVFEFEGEEYVRGEPLDLNEDLRTRVGDIVIVAPKEAGRLGACKTTIARLSRLEFGHIGVGGFVEGDINLHMQAQEHTRPHPEYWGPKCSYWATPVTVTQDELEKIWQ